MMNEFEYRQAVINSRNKTTKLDREGEYWTEKERNQLRTLFESGVGLTDITMILQRTKPAVYQQAVLMGLYPPSPSRRRSAPKTPACLCATCQLDPAFCPHRERYPYTQEDA